MSHIFKDILVVIPARKGSKRLPGKNYKQLNGKPLIAYSIEYALENVSVEDILVSTDDPEIVKVANKYQVMVLDRPARLSQDDTSTAEVLQHVAHTVQKSYRYLALLQPTNPMRPKHLFEQCYNKLKNAKGDSSLCVSTNKRKLGEIKHTVFNPSTYHFGQRSQDLSPLFYENGLLYISTFELIKKGQILSEKPIAVVVDHPFATIDIDSELDFDWAELILNKYDD